MDAVVRPTTNIAKTTAMKTNPEPQGQPVTQIGVGSCDLVRSENQIGSDNEASPQFRIGKTSAALESCHLTKMQWQEWLDQCLVAIDSVARTCHEAEKMRRALDQWKAPGRPDPELWQQMFPSAYAGKSPRVDE